MVIIILNIIVAAGIFCWLFFSAKNLPKYDYSIEDWKSEHAVYENNGLNPDGSLRNSGLESELLWGPYRFLKKGSYTAVINYSADEDQSCLATASGGLAQMFDSSKGLLSHHFHTVNYQFEVLDDVDEFQLVIYYTGTGNFTVHSISVVSNNNQIKRISAELIFAVFCLFSRQEKEKRRTFALLMGICAFVSIPLAVKGINNGADLGIHYLRIEAILQAIRSGQFPARISSVTLYGLGYPFSIYYNDLFLYFPAILRLLGFSVNTAYKIYIFSVNFLTVFFSYFSFRKIFGKKNISMILTLLYASASYRMLNIWIRGAAGEYTAQIFLPIVALALFRIFKEENFAFRQMFANGALLAAGMTGIIGSHQLSMLMTCFAIAVTCLFFWKKTIRIRTLSTFGIAVFLTFLLNLYFLVPFVDYYINEPTFIKSMVDADATMIQRYGAYPFQYVDFFQSLNGEFSFPLEGRLQYTPGLALMAVFFFGIFQRFRDKGSQFFRFSLFLSFLMLFIASDIFPWNWLTLHVPYWKLLTTIQFPWRFLGIASLSLTLLAGIILENEKIPEYFVPGLLISVLLMSVWFWGDLTNNSKTIYIYDTSGVLPTWTGLEYLLDGSEREKIVAEAEGMNMEKAESVYRSSNVLKVQCIAGFGEGPHLVTAPVYNYKGYHVTDMDGNELIIQNGDQNRIMFEVPDGFEGIVTIVFRDPVYWRLSLIVSGLSFAFLIGFFLIGKKKDGKVLA